MSAPELKPTALRCALNWLRTGAEILRAQWWLTGLIGLVTSIVAAVIVTGLAGFAGQLGFVGQLRNAQLDVILGEIDAGGSALIAVLVQIGVPGLVLIALVSAAGAGAIAVVADQRLRRVRAGGGETPLRAAVARAVRRAPISAATAVIACTVVAVLVCSVALVSLLGILALACQPLLRRAARRSPLSALGRFARTLTLRRALLLLIPFGLPVVLTLRWMLAFPIAVLEPLGPLAALRRSAEQLRGRQTALLLAGGGALLVAVAAQLVLGALIGLVSADIAILAQAGLQLLLAPLALIVAVVALHAGQRVPDAAGDSASRRTAELGTAALGTGASPSARRLAGTAAVLSLSMVLTVLVPIPGAASAAELRPVTVTVTSTPNPSDLDQEVAFTVTVAADDGSTDVPTGYFAVFAGGQTIASELPLKNGSRVVRVSSLASGSHEIVARYFGDGTFASSEGAVSHTVTGGVTRDTAVTIAASDEPSRYGADPTFTAQITAADGSALSGDFTPASGSASFMVGSRSFDVSVGFSGAATLTLDQYTRIGVGEHEVSFSYPGNERFAAASVDYVHTVSKTATSFDVDVSPAVPRTGQSYQITVTALPAVVWGRYGPAGHIWLMHPDDSYNYDTFLDAATSSYTFDLTAPESPGVLDFRLRYPGNDFFEEFEQAVSVTVSDRIPTRTVLDGVPSAMGLGDTLALRAEVQAGAGEARATGDVEFVITPQDGAPVTHRVALAADGTAQHGYVPPGAGSFEVTAAYMGSSTHEPALSSAATVVVTKQTPSLTLTQASVSSGPGQSVEFSASLTGIAGFTPTGSVVFSAGAGVTETVPLNAQGVALFASDALAAGATTVTASYSGDQNSLAATDSLTHTVVAAASTTTVSASPAALAWGQPATLTATVKSQNGRGPTPGGAVEFSWPGGSETALLDASGVARAVLSSLPVSTVTITARYGGSSSYVASAGTASVTIARAATTTTVVSASPVSLVGQEVSYTATVSGSGAGRAGGGPSGTVTFSGVPGAADVTVPVGADGVARATVTTAVGTSSAARVWASYSGDAHFVASVGHVEQTVKKAEATLAVTAAAASAALGDSVTLTVVASSVAPAGGLPAGTLQVVRDGFVLLGRSVDSSGTTALSVPVSWLGDASLTITLSSSTHTAPPSNAVIVTGRAFTPALTLTSLTAAPLVGDPVTLRARLNIPNGYSLSGKISFYDGTTLLTSRPVSRSGIIVHEQDETFTTSALTAGTHQLHAVFESDVPRAANARSLDTALKVGEIRTVTTILSPDQIRVGAPITWLLSVNTPDWAWGKPEREPRGRVDLYLAGARVGSAAVTTSSSGRAYVNISTAALTAGTHQVEARFVPSSLHAASTASAELVVFASESLLTATTTTAPDVEWGTPLVYRTTVEPRTGNWPAPTGLITAYFEDGTVACATQATGGECSVVWSAAGAQKIRFEYPGDAVHSPVSVTRTVTVRKRTPVLESTLSATRAITAEPLTVGWDLSGPPAAKITVRGTDKVATCDSTTLRSACELTFPVSADGKDVHMTVAFAGDDLWKPAFVEHRVSVLGCYPLALTVSPAEAGTLRATRPADCNGGTGYLSGSKVGVIAVPTIDTIPSFDWKIARLQPGAAVGTSTESGTELEIVVGHRYPTELAPGPTNWVRAEFDKVYNCYTVELVAEGYRGAAGTLTAAAPDCPVDTEGQPVSKQRWARSVHSDDHINIVRTTLSGRVLAGSVVPVAAAVGNDESEVYGFSDMASGNASLSSAPSIRADGPGRVSRVLFGPVCHGLETSAVGPGTVLPVSAEDCYNPLTKATGWTKGFPVEVVALAAEGYEAPNYLVDWTGTAAASGTPLAFTRARGYQIRVADGRYLRFGVGDQTNTVTIAGMERADVATQRVSATFASCVRLTLSTTLIKPAAGTVEALTPGNCPGYESDKQLYASGTPVELVATTIDSSRKAPYRISTGEIITVDSKVTSHFGEWSDGDNRANRTFTITNNTKLSGSFWYSDRASKVKACAEIELKSAYPERLMVSLHSSFDWFEGCPRGNLDAPGAGSKQGTYLTTVEPDRVGEPPVYLNLLGTDTAADSSALVGWQFRLSNYPDSAVKGYYAGHGLEIEGATQEITATAMLCETLDLMVTLKNDRGELVTQPVPDGSSLVMVSPAPNCPFNDRAWTVGTMVKVGAFGDTTGYAFTEWSGTASGTTQNTEIHMDGIGHKRAIAGYTVTCYTLTLTHDAKDVTRYPEPNCPGYDPAESRYAGGEMVMLTGRVPGGKVWQGWVGDLTKTGKVNPAIVIMDADKSAGHRWRSRDSTEEVGAAFSEVGDFFVSISDEVAIVAKKMVGVVALAITEIAKWMPPMGIINAIALAADQLADLLAVMGVPSGSVEWLKAGKKVMDFMYSGLSCATVWAMNGNGNEKDNLLAKPDGAAGGGGWMSAANDAKDGALGAKAGYTTAGFVNAARGGYMSSKAFAIKNAVGGLGAGSVVIGGIGTMGAIIMDGGFGIDASAEAAWTNSDAYTSCLASKIPKF